MTPLPAAGHPALSYYSERCGGDDYLFDKRWHTHPGRMAAYCPHDPKHPDYRISAYELPADLPDATRYWVAGFLAGNLPAPPDGVSERDELMERWARLA